MGSERGLGESASGQPGTEYRSKPLALAMGYLDTRSEQKRANRSWDQFLVSDSQAKAGPTEMMVGDCVMTRVTWVSTVVRNLHRGFVYLISWGRVVLVPISAHETRVSTKLIVSYSSTLSEASNDCLRNKAGPLDS